jgi:chemotaxis protein MotB
MPIRPPKGFIDESDPRVALIGHPAPAWLINYADLMTELVCFFVILYALSAALNKNVQNAAQQVKEMMKKGEMSGSVKINKEGLQITLQEQGMSPFFQSGSADPTPEIETVLAKLAPTLNNLAKTNDILIEGHTDNQPINNQYFDSNWELSTARATTIARILIDKFSLPPSHMAAVGYGPYHPIAPNDTEQNRAKNRRVVIMIKNSSPSELKPEAPPATAQAP